MKFEELKQLFEDYLHRDPTKSEVGIHLKKNYTDFEIEISNCPERLQLIKSKGVKKYKIALLLSGHVRSLPILNSLNNITKDYNIDVFVSTWDNIGMKGQETNINDNVNPDLVLSRIQQLPNLKKYIIENNKEYILKNENKKVIYFNHSSPEIFIKSQLYSINKSFNLLKEYIEETNTNYDMVIRARMDSEINKFFVTEKMINDINQNKIIFVPNDNCGHDHPDNGTSCHACDTMYYKYDLKDVHIFEHTNIICDIFAYGSIDSMEKYCSLIHHYDELNKNFEKENLSWLENNNGKIKYQKKDNVYHILNEKHQDGHIKSTFYLNCSYPERLLQKLLKDYMLVKSKNIEVKFKR